MPGVIDWAISASCGRRSATLPAMTIDFHCHTTASDGELSPRDLLELAQRCGVTRLSITDHDSVAAYQGLNPLTGLELIGGVEFSTLWNKTGLHILGLNIDPFCPAMQEAVAFQRNARLGRAEKIAEKLEKYGVVAPLEGARSLASAGNVGRPHFARHMVATGFVKDEKEAFKKYLGSGKSCDIRQCWAEPEQIVAWIRAAGGVAVLAHPAKYNLTRSKLVSFLEAFKGWGGGGLEVVSGIQLPAVTRDLAQLCEQLDLSASWGSDFHRPGQSWAQLGRYSAPPPHLRPVWHNW